MAIVVLGWGSLCWDPGELRIRDGWHTDGPLLPIEFARISKHGRLTLVLHKRAKRVRVLWADMNTVTISEAIGDLKKREETPNEKNIGWIDLHKQKNNNCNTFRTALGIIKKWALTKHFDAVVWTDLPTNFRERTGKEFNKNNVITYLSNLDNGSRQKAEEYIRRAPREIRTRMRSTIEDQLGWTHNSGL